MVKGPRNSRMPRALCIVNVGRISSATHFQVMQMSDRSLQLPMERGVCFNSCQFRSRHVALVFEWCTATQLSIRRQTASRPTSRCNARSTLHTFDFDLHSTPHLLLPPTPVSVLYGHPYLRRLIGSVTTRRLVFALSLSNFQQPTSPCVLMSTSVLVATVVVVVVLVLVLVLVLVCCCVPCLYSFLDPFATSFCLSSSLSSPYFRTSSLSSVCFLFKTFTVSTTFVAVVVVVVVVVVVPSFRCCGDFAATSPP